MPKIPAHGWKEAVKILESDGFTLEREEGEHMAYWKEGLVRPVIVQKKNELPKFIVQNIIKTSRIGRDKYLSYLSPGKKSKRLSK